MSSTSRTEARSGAPRRPRRERGGTSARQQPETSALEAHLGYWLRLVSNHVSHAFRMKVERHGVTVAEWVVMRALFDDERLKPSELADRLALSRGAISKLLARLAAKDLVVIAGDSTDGRMQVIALRPAGRRLVPVLASLADANDAETFGHLSDDQRRMLRAILETLVDRLDLRGTPVA